MIIFSSIKRLWSWLTLPKLTGWVFDYRRSSWGHRIHRWDKRPDGRWLIMGHGPPVALYRSCLRPGDVILAPMESGKVGRFVILEAWYFCNIKDMFSAVVVRLNYHEETTV